MLSNPTNMTMVQSEKITQNNQLCNVKENRNICDGKNPTENKWLRSRTNKQKQDTTADFTDAGKMEHYFSTQMIQKSAKQLQKKQVDSVGNITIRTSKE